MNILGIYGSLGWDGNILQHLHVGIGHDSGTLRVHGAGATLIMNGDLNITFEPLGINLQSFRDDFWSISG